MDFPCKNIYSFLFKNFITLINFIIYSYPISETRPRFLQCSCLEGNCGINIKCMISYLVNISNIIFQAILPVFIKQIHDSPGEGVQLFGVTASMINLVALVRNIEHSSTKITYLLEDYSGIK